MRKRGKGLDLTSGSYKKRKNTGLFLIAFCCFALVFGSVSVLMFLRSVDYDLSNILRSDETTSQVTTSEQPSAAPVISGKTDFLLLLVSDDGKALETAAVIRADADAARLSVCTLSMSSQCIINGKAELLSDVYSSGGAVALRDATGILTGTKAARYLKITDSGIKKIFRTLGDVQLNIPERTEYRDGDTVLVLDAGVQKLSGDMLTKYLDYLNTQKSAQYAAEEKNRIICAVLDCFATPEYSEKGEKLFSSLINSVTTDISAVDYISHEAAIKQFIKSVASPAQAVSSVSELIS